MCFEFGYFGARENEFKKVFPHLGSEALLWAYMLAMKLKRGLQNATSNFWYRMIDRDVLDLGIYLQVSETQRSMAWSHRKF